MILVWMICIGHINLTPSLPRRVLVRACWDILGVLASQYVNVTGDNDAICVSQVQEKSHIISESPNNFIGYPLLS